MPEDLQKLLRERMQALEEPDISAIVPPQQEIERRLGIPQRGETFAQRNYAGFPIDVTTGAPGLVRFGLAARDTEEDQMEYLSKVYGKGMARKSDTGEWIVKTVDRSGKPKEIKVNEEGLSGRDIMSMAAYAPETIGAILAMRAGRGIPGFGTRKGVTGFARDVSAEAIGQEAGGAVKDVGARGISGQPVEPGEIASRRLGNLPFDMAIGTGLGIIGKAASKAITPLGPPTEIVDIEAAEARRRLAEQTGVDIPQSIGEQTGSKVFKRVEATAAQLPGSSKYFSELTEQKTAALRKTINRIMGIPDDQAPGTVIGTAEDIGTEAVASIRSKLTPMQEAIESSRNQVVRETNQKVLDELADATTPQRQIYPEKVGASIRQKAHELQELFRAQSRANYDAALALEGGRDRIFETPALSKEAKKLIDSLPQRTEISEQVAYDNYGNPIAKSIEGKTPSKEFVPDSIVGKLRELSSAPKEKRSLADLISMRSEVDNEIAAGEAIPGRQTKYLSQIRKSLSDAIDTAVASSKDPNLKTAYEKANAFYRDNVGQFKDKYVARLFREIQEGGGFINDEDIVRNIGPTEYQSFKTLLGASSPEFTNLKRALADEIYNSALLPGEQIIKGDALIKNLSNFYKKNRSVAEEIFGTKATELQRLGEILGGAEPKLDADKLKTLVRAGEPLSRSIEKLVAEQATLDKTYRSQILKDIGERRIGESLNAGEFVNRFYDTASKPELESVMAQLADNPDVVEKLRRKAIERVLFSAQRTAKASDPSALGRGDPLLPPNSQALRSAVGDLDKRERLMVILGPETYNAITDLAKVTRASDLNESAFKSAGGLVAGSQISSMLQGGVIGYASDYVKQRLASIVLANPILRRWAANGVMNTPLEVGGVRLANTKEGALMTALIGSTPFLEAVVDEFGEGTAANEFLTAIRRSINMFESDKAVRKEPTAKELLDQRIFEIK